MSRYNHFKQKYHTLCFGEVAIGEKFRMDKFNGKRRRNDIVMVKTSDLSYRELISKKAYKVYSSAFDVSQYQAS